MLKRQWYKSQYELARHKTQARVISCLIEGCSIRATVRMTGAAKNTVVKLLADIGCACAAYHNRYVRNLKVRRLQADEIWCFVGAKAKNVSAAKEARRLGRHLDVGWNRRGYEVSRFVFGGRSGWRMGKRVYGRLRQPDH